jgi:hypothetical protein
MPSSFATLFRHSKFASFDPAISQVYTSYGGDAHRGHWGLKRNLPLRRRNKFITAQTIDSPEQQTEWSNAESQARFIRRWNELDVDVHVSATRIQNSSQWRVDSEFAPLTTEDGTPKDAYWAGDRTTAVPNIHAMTNKEFTSYLKKLRQLRPAFKEYLRETLTLPKLRRKSLYELAQIRDSDYHQRFIASKTLETFNANHSRKIEPIPHRTGGLLYSHPSALETVFTTRSQPGIILKPTPYDRHFRRKDQPMVASFAGLYVTVRNHNADGKVPIFDMNEGIKSEKAQDSITNMRIVTIPTLLSVPKVVGRAITGLNGAKLDVEVTAQTDFMRSNPYQPGSREYNSMEDVAERITPMKWQRHSVPSKVSHYNTKVLLDTLREIRERPRPVV